MRLKVRETVPINEVLRHLQIGEGLIEDRLRRRLGHLTGFAMLEIKQMHTAALARLTVGGRGPEHRIYPE